MWSVKYHVNAFKKISTRNNMPLFPEWDGNIYNQTSEKGGYFFLFFNWGKKKNFILRQE